MISREAQTVSSLILQLRFSNLLGSKENIPSLTWNSYLKFGSFPKLSEYDDMSKWPLTSYIQCHSTAAFTLDPST